MNKFIKDLQCQNIEQVFKSLDEFCVTHARTMQFGDLNRNSMRSEIWRLLFEKLSDEKNIPIYEKCIQTLRILSRDKTDLDSLVTDDRLNFIIDKANLSLSAKSHTNNVILEALKLICNLIYNSPHVQTLILKTSCLKNLVERISTYNVNIPYEIKLFDVRILFLVTALNTTLRQSLKYELNVADHLIDMLEALSSEIEQNESEKKESVAVTCEILKTLFNMYIVSDDSTVEEQEKYIKLNNIIYRLLIINNFNGREELQSHVINLLIIIPKNSYSSIIKPLTDIEHETKKEIFNNMDMTAISELLKFLEERLSNHINIPENILPVLTVLLKLSSYDRLVRKYCRKRVLPPLRDVMRRPEEGTSLKANLCKLLVSPSIELKNLVAEFLFILCKENVGRMIKYTGYGNAAGMFANKGLLGCQQPEIDYSSDSDESDTEEYLKFKEVINPVTGCYEKPKPSPFVGMSEEQKEYEAMKLVNLVNQLNNDGVVRPCTIGDNGKPKPIEHILELQAGFQKESQDIQDSDSDS